MLVLRWNVASEAASPIVLKSITSRASGFGANWPVVSGHQNRNTLAEIFQSTSGVIELKTKGVERIVP